jgi:site-specific DNA-methyltransferase (adenine-specific)
MDWETPQDFFDEIDNEFHFTLDACANETNHKCDKYFSESDDGLKQNWGGADGLV